MANAYLQFLESLDPDQRAHIDNQFRAVVAGVQTNKRNGTFTMKITMVPNGSKVTVKHEAKANVPGPTTESKVFWHGKEGELLEEDPKQQKLPLRSVPSNVTNLDPKTN